MQAALYGALTSNPDLVTLRQGNALAVSAEAVEVARHFPTTLNPTLWIDYRPITLVPNGTFGTREPRKVAPAGQNGFYHFGQNYIYISLRQPIELGHQTTHRYHIAEAAYDQQKWIVVQAELTALVQTYRFFQTAAYRREKYRLAQQLADFNDRLLQSLQRRMEANQVQAADVALARVESRATRQQVKAARQDYLTALTDLRNQIGIPEPAGAVEPLGEFTLPAYIPPVDEQVMIQRRSETARTSTLPMPRSPALTPPSTWQRAIESPRRSSVRNTRWTRRACSTSGSSSSRRCRSGTTASRWSFSARPSTGGRSWPTNKPSSARPPRFGRLSPSGTAQPSW